MSYYWWRHVARLRRFVGIDRNQGSNSTMANPSLTDVKGIGPAAAAALKAKRITVAKITTMTPEKLSLVPGIGLVSARHIIVAAKAAMKGGAATAAKKPVAKKAPAKKAPARKAPAKKAPAKKAPAKKAPAKKAPAKKAPAKKAPAKKAPAAKTPARKTPVKKAPARKAPARKAPAKK